jgi:SnoaL-like domain
MNQMSLEDRIRRLEDIEAIKNLMARYAFHVNKGWDGKVVDVEQMPSIYAQDVRWESNMGAGGAGLDKLMGSLKQDTEILDFSMHSLINPIVEVDGDNGTGNWLMWMAVKREGGPRLVFSSIDLTYTRTSEGWRIQSARLHIGAAFTGFTSLSRPPPPEKS